MKNAVSHLDAKTTEFLKKKSRNMDCLAIEDKKEDQCSSKTTELFNGKKTENIKKV